mgnify:CR=1 FL=1
MYIPYYKSYRLFILISTTQLSWPICLKSAGRIPIISLILSFQKELKQFPNNDGMFFELLSKGVDAVVFDMPVVTAFANSAGKGKAKVVGPLYEGQKYGIGFAQGNEELVKKVNGVLDQMRKDGSYAKLYEKWFGFAPKESDM